MSFANEFKRAVKEIDEEIAYYRGFATTRRDRRADVHSGRSARRLGAAAAAIRGAGKTPSEPDDWEEDKATRLRGQRAFGQDHQSAAEAAERGHGRADAKQRPARAARRAAGRDAGGNAPASESQRAASTRHAPSRQTFDRRTSSLHSSIVSAWPICYAGCCAGHRD